MVAALEEKSHHPKSTQINAGAYLSPDIFDLVDQVETSSRGELELTDALEVFIREQRLTAFEICSWKDIGYPWDLLDANAACMMSLPGENHGVIENNVTISGAVAIGEGSVVKSGTTLRGRVVLVKIAVSALMHTSVDRQASGITVTSAIAQRAEKFHYYGRNKDSPFQLYR